MFHLFYKIKGFTLIEIMVVMVIIGVILGFATLSIGDGGQARKLEQEVQRLASLLTLASEEAIMQAKEMGVYFEKEGYRFYENGQVLTMQQDDLFRPRILPSGIQTEIRLEGEPVILNNTKNEPQLWLLSSGEFTPFEVIFTVESDETLRYRLTGTVTGIMNIQRDEVF
ncbi:type II secretion system minor pseudopilin GspH [Candidatus Parabeggiatoa sp. HSG14]|uniref:type II secretion system minor pseudopilin GspH n=1 Tax=Candidatus Parabeggiatoa sp. HSG14 TaxID=3055593 RepID=UPI0025A7FD36|nr:type II secretion system minor pseudopilin GspH [Thiotrichales bacterium HSG14]